MELSIWYLCAKIWQTIYRKTRKLFSLHKNQSALSLLEIPEDLIKNYYRFVKIKIQILILSWVRKCFDFFKILIIHQIFLHLFSQEFLECTQFHNKSWFEPISNSCVCCSQFQANATDKTLNSVAFIDYFQCYPYIR